MNTNSALLLVNPNSRRGKESLPVVRQHLSRAGVAYLELPPESVEPPSNAIVRLAGRVNSVIVGGGDGSLNSAAKGLLDTGLPLGVLPLGTANDFARTIGLPLDLATAIDVIAKGKTASIDLGEANGQPFFNVASI